jgi:hypothetical protein
MSRRRLPLNLSALAAVFTAACTLYPSRGGEVGVYRARDAGIVDANRNPADALIDTSHDRYRSAGDADVDAPTETQEGLCQEKLSLVKAPDISSKLLGIKTVCLGQWASQTYRYAVCSCNNARFDGFAVTGTFDSTVDPSAQNTSGWGSAFGINEEMSVSGAITLAGSLTVTGDDGLSLHSAATVQGDLRVRGPLVNEGATGVARNVWLASNLSGDGILTVNGNLRQPVGATRDSVAVVFGNDLRAPVSIAPPCACSDDELLDIESVVLEGKTRNDNDEVGFDRNRLVNVSTADTLDLPCGRLYASSIKISGSLGLLVRGPSTLMVEGDVDSEGALIIDIRDKGKLDLFIGGDLSLSSIQTVGNRAVASNLRVYVAGSGHITFSGLSSFSGALYAPRARVELEDAITIRGSIFVGNITTSDTAAILYDRALLRQGDECNPKPRSCYRCNDCVATEACINGQCGACQTDTDCCEPLICSAGQCSAILS